VDDEPLILASARKHGVDDDDILHAYAHPVGFFQLPEGVLMVVGPAFNGVTLLEIGFVHRYGAVAVIHAMSARQRFIQGGSK
jgi:hypothetical protein